MINDRRGYEINLQPVFDYREVLSAIKIVKIRYYDGAKEKICRLEPANLFLEIQDIFLSRRA
jgi:hypothetical protein